MARFSRNIRDFTTPISWDPAHDVAKYHFCHKCRMKLVVFGSIPHDQLQSFFNSGPSAAKRQWLPICKPNQKLYHLLAHVTQDGNIVFAMKYLILGINFECTFEPRELGIDPIYEFDSSAAEWLNIT